MSNDVGKRYASLTAEFPQEELIGLYGDWILPLPNDGSTSDDDSNDTDDFEDEILVSGRFLGIGSTRTQQHVVRMPDGKYVQHPSAIVPDGLKCRACRWFEVRLFHDSTDDLFVIYYSGRSIVPGESQRCRFVEVKTHYEVFTVLSVEQKPRDDSSNTNPLRTNRFFFTNPVLRLLAQASSFHDGIKDAYVSYTSSSTSNR